MAQAKSSGKLSSEVELNLRAKEFKIRPLRSELCKWGEFCEQKEKGLSRLTLGGNITKRLIDIVVVSNL